MYDPIQRVLTLLEILQAGVFALMMPGLKALRPLSLSAFAPVCEVLALKLPRA